MKLSMSDSILSEIMKLCVQIDKTASKIYAVFAERADNENEKKFWLDVSHDEESHISYWEKILELLGMGNFRNPFNELDQIKTQLDKTISEMDQLLLNKSKFSDNYTSFLLALKLETLMLHPIFFVLFRGLKAEIDIKSPEDEYRKHIEKFLSHAKKIYWKKTEIGLLCELLSTMCDHATFVANQFEQIMILRNFIPICSYCKKIRDDKGYWEEIEKYLLIHDKLIFSHGICPKCESEHLK